MLYKVGIKTSPVQCRVSPLVSRSQSLLVSFVFPFHYGMKKIGGEKQAVRAKFTRTKSQITSPLQPHHDIECPPPVMILPPPLGAAVVQLQQLVRPEPQQRRAVRPRPLPPRRLRGRARDGGRGRGGAGELPVAGGDLFPVCGAACREGKVLSVKALVGSVIFHEVRLAAVPAGEARWWG